MKNILLYMMSLVALASCSNEPDITTCSDPVQKVNILLSETPDDWTIKTKTDNYDKVETLTHRSGVVLQRLLHKHYMSDSWEEANKSVWQFVKPYNLPLTASENAVIDEAYLSLVYVKTNKVRCAISDALGDVGIPSDSEDYEINEKNNRNDFGD